MYIAHTPRLSKYNTAHGDETDTLGAAWLSNGSDRLAMYIVLTMSYQM